jgi:SAM-dependent methyltransferase
MDDDALVFSELLDRIQDSLRDWIAGGIGTLEGRPESWGFVGVRSAQALAQLRLARQATAAKSPAFLECGSGFGFVAALARELGFNVTGIEVVPTYVEQSRRFFPSVRVEEADLLTFDRFGAFDVIYYFNPFADDEVQAGFERRIEAALRPGGIIIANRKLTHSFREGGTFDVLATDETFGWVIQKR